MTTPESLPEESARGIGLASVVEILRRRRLLALLPFVFVLAATASVALFLPSLWTARAKVLANQQQIPETFVKSTADTDVEARLMTLTQDILDTPRLSQVILDNDLRWRTWSSVCARTSSSSRRRIAPAAAASPAGWSSAWPTRPGIRA